MVMYIGYCGIYGEILRENIAAIIPMTGIITYLHGFAVVTFMMCS